MAGVWTKNFQAFKNIWLCGDANYALSCLKDSDGNLRWTVSDTVNYHENQAPTMSPMTYCQAADSAFSSYVDICFIRLGVGSTAPAADDYNLEEVATGIAYLSAVNEKPVWNDSTGEVSNTVKLTVQNTTGANITIREWGVFGHLHLFRGSTTNVRFMLYRATLDAAVTLAPSQSAMLTLTRSVTLTDPVVWPE